MEIPYLLDSSYLEAIFSIAGDEGGKMKNPASQGGGRSLVVRREDDVPEVDFINLVAIVDGQVGGLGQVRQFDV